jgi:hypothetical protein
MEVGNHVLRLHDLLMEMVDAGRRRRGRAIHPRFDGLGRIEFTACRASPAAIICNFADAAPS